MVVSGGGRGGHHAAMNADGMSSSDSASPLLHPADEFDVISGFSLNPQSADRVCVCVCV